MELFRCSIWLKYAFEIFFYVSNSDQGFDSEKLPKMLLFSNLESAAKDSLSAFTERKINVVGILGRFAAYFVKNLFWLANWIRILASW